jgi:8-oxo-dGTP pyrophosphatase MutT (NUDIX family)
MAREISAGAVVFKRNKDIKFLLLNYESGHWDFPKGNVEKGEDKRETAIREIREETSLKNIKIIEGFENKISYFYKREGKTIYKEVTFYLAETTTDTVSLSYEHRDYVWLNYQDAIKKLTYKNAKETLKKAWEFLNAAGGQ